MSERTPFGEIEVVEKIEIEDEAGDLAGIEYVLRVKALLIGTAKNKARLWARMNNPLEDPRDIRIIQVLDPSTGGVIEGDVPHTISVEDIDESDFKGILMRDTFDVQLMVVD